MASRWGASTSSLPSASGTDWKVSASTKRLPLRSTRRDSERRKSAPSKGRDTSATTKFHLYWREAMCRETVHVPYVLILLPLAAVSVCPGCSMRVSRPVAGMTLTSAPVSTRNRRVGINVSVGRTDKALCPVSAVLAYMAVRGPGPGSLFQFQDGRFLTRARLVMRGEGSYLGSGSGQLTVLGAQLPKRCSNYSCQAEATIQKLEEQRLPKIQDRSWRVSMLTQSK